MKVDFLILYEHIERELENACLIKVSLEQKGYSVKIRSIYSLAKNYIVAKVLIVPHLYNNSQVNGFICKYKSRKCKVINLQYEQVLSPTHIDSGYSIPKDKAKKCVIFAWGNTEASRYLEDKEQKVIISGCISMEFNLVNYLNYFLSKEDLCNKYGIKNKKIILFISSFSLSNVSDDYLKLHYMDRYAEMKIFSNISKDSKHIILTWLNRYCQEYSDYCVIYRPHPAEYIDNEILTYESKNNNFKIIREYSIRQWILVSDYLSTWFSTSIVDAYYAKKQCLVLRPYQIQEKIDVSFLHLSKSISNYEDFVYELTSKETKFPVDSVLIHKYYKNEIGKQNLGYYINCCEKIFSDESYEAVFDSEQKYGLILSIKMRLRELMNDIGTYIDISWIYKKLYKNNQEKKIVALKLQRELYHSKKLEHEYLERLKMINE